MGPELWEPHGTAPCFQHRVTVMQQFHIRLLDQAGRAIQTIPALAETETIALVRAAHLANETGAADFEVQARRRYGQAPSRL